MSEQVPEPHLPPTMSRSVTPSPHSTMRTTTSRCINKCFSGGKMSEEYYYHNISLDALDDLACRFLLSLPHTDKTDPIRWELYRTISVWNYCHSGSVLPSSRRTGSTWNITARRLRLVRLRRWTETSRVKVKPAGGQRARRETERVCQGVCSSFVQVDLTIFIYIFWSWRNI